MTAFFNHEKNSPAAAIFLFAALGGGMAAAVICSFLPPDISRAITREGGIVESASALLWLAAAGILAAAAATDIWASGGGSPVGGIRRLALAALPLAAGLRELDWHKKFTADSILKSNYWLGKIPAPAGEKIAAAIILTAVLLAAAVVAARCGRPFIAALRAREPVAWQIAASLALLFISKNFLDGINRKLAPLEMSLGPLATEFAHTWEEWMEFTAALLVCGAAFFAFARRRQTV